MTGAIYFFLIAGGLWHILNVFQSLMRALAAPIIILLAVIACIDFYFENSAHHLNRSGRPSKLIFRIVAYAVFIVCVSYLIELVGMRSGMIFGHYKYSSLLKPQIAHVPVAIGFAWLGMLLSSYAVVHYLKPASLKVHPIFSTLLIALFMVVFDMFMEPAAIKLNYWTWRSGQIPVQNYIAWFVISLLFIVIGQIIDIYKLKPSRLMMHIYFAQLIYFIMIFFK